MQNSTQKILFLSDPSILNTSLSSILVFCEFIPSFISIFYTVQFFVSFLPLDLIGHMAIVERIHLKIRYYHYYCYCCGDIIIEIHQ